VFLARIPQDEENVAGVTAPSAAISSIVIGRAAKDCRPPSARTTMPDARNCKPCSRSARNSRDENASVQGAQLPFGGGLGVNDPRRWALLAGLGIGSRRAAQIAGLIVTPRQDSGEDDKGQHNGSNDENAGDRHGFLLLRTIMPRRAPISFDMNQKPWIKPACVIHGLTDIKAPTGGIR
jgi:hypothetical protein